MKQFEEKLAREKEEIRLKAERDRAMIENQVNLKHEEKQHLINELMKKEQEQEKAKNKQ
jgi:hypothetical protein